VVKTVSKLITTMFIFYTSYYVIAISDNALWMRLFNYRYVLIPAYHVVDSLNLKWLTYRNKEVCG